MTRSVALDELERSLAAVLRQLTERATVSDLAERCGHDLPPASWALLEHLDALGPLRVSDIAACHGVDISSVTPRLKRLDSAGLVTRGRAPTDARVSLISITAQGAEALESLHAARREVFQQSLEGVDTSQVRCAAEVLTHIALATRSTPEPDTGLTGSGEPQCCATRRGSRPGAPVPVGSGPADRPREAVSAQAGPGAVAARTAGSPAPRPARPGPAGPGARQRHEDCGLGLREVGE